MIARDCDDAEHLGRPCTAPAIVYSRPLRARAEGTIVDESAAEPYRGESYDAKAMRAIERDRERTRRAKGRRR